MTRRELLKIGVAAGAGLAGLAAFGCAPAPPPSSPAAPSGGAAAPSGGQAPAPAATSVPAKSAPPPPKGPTQVNIIIGTEISTFDPVKTNAMENVSVISGVTNKLVRMSKTKYGEVEPLLATSWEAVEPIRWRLKLRQGVKFHNGAEFNAETAKWSLEHYAKNGLFIVLRDALDRVDVVDKSTIDVVTKFPTGLLPLMLNGGSEQMDPKWMTGAEYGPEKLVGTGPAKFVEWVKGQRIVLEANPDYWGGRLSYDRAILRAIPEASTRANAAIAGEGDITRNILPQDAERVKTRPGVKLTLVDSNRTAMIRIRDDVAPFDNKLVRQALNYAVNVPEIVTNVLKGYGKPLSGWVQGPQVRHFQKDVQSYPYDPEKAKLLLAQAGFPRGITTKIGTSRGRDQGDFEFVQALAGQLKGAGVEAEVKLYEAGDYQAMYSGQKDSDPLFYWSTGNIIPDVENTLRDILAPRSFMMRSKELEEIYARLQRTVDVKEREPIAREAVLFIRDYAPCIFGYQLVQAYAVSDKVEWIPRSDEWILLDEIKLKA